MRVFVRAYMLYNEDTQYAHGQQHAALCPHCQGIGIGLLAPLCEEHQHMVFPIVIWSPRQEARSQRIGSPIPRSLASPYRDHQGTAEVVMRSEERRGGEE